jgi:hypothetical protein
MPVPNGPRDSPTARSLASACLRVRMAVLTPVSAPPRQTPPDEGGTALPALGTGATATAALSAPEKGATATVADGQGPVPMQVGPGAGPDAAGAAASPPPQKVVVDLSQMKF